MCRSNKQSTKNRGKTWSRGTNLRLPFGVNVNLNLSLIKTIRTLSYIFPLFDSVLPAISRSHNGSCYHFIHKFEKLNSVTVFWANESFTGSVSNSISSMRRSVSSLDETLRRELKIRRVVEYFRRTSRCFI